MINPFTMTMEAEAIEPAVPSQPQVEYEYRKVILELERVEGSFSKITGWLRRLKGWQHRGLVDAVRIDELVDRDECLKDWLRRIRELILDVGDLDVPRFINGDGI